MKKVLFAVNDLTKSDESRVLVDIVNRFHTKYDITILSLFHDNDYVHDLNGIKTVYITDRDKNTFEKKITRFRLFFPSKRKFYHNYFVKDKYDVVIAFNEKEITWILSYEKKARKIAWIHSDIEEMIGSKKRSRTIQKMNRRAYKTFDELVFTSNYNYDRFYQLFDDIKISGRVIYNYIDVKSVKTKAFIMKAPDIKKDMLSFLQISPLEENSAIDRLISIHKRLIDEGYIHRIYILGKGSLKNELKSLIKKEKLEDTFVLLGDKPNPFIYIKSADYILHATKKDGYRMCLIDAQMLSKFVIVTDTDARETIIGYNHAKLLLNNDESIYEGLKEIITTKPKVYEENHFTNDNVLYEIIDVIEGKQE